MKNMLSDLLESWANVDGNVHSLNDISIWVENIKKSTHVKINECSIKDSDFWFYDDYIGEVLNIKSSFFSIRGMRLFHNNKFICEQPIIIQPEIGYLGIICKKINGVLNFLMQAKIEPGNVNYVQISPTIQATKSNFTRVHGGRLPTYFSYFENASDHHIIYDQIQSEQASRFYKKRNRNIIICIDEDIEVHQNFMWMTLGQIKKLMEVENLVNMDTRTVISGIPLVTERVNEEELKRFENLFTDADLFSSIFRSSPGESLSDLYYVINNYKMFHDVRKADIPLNQLVDWDVDDFGIMCNKKADFMVRYYNIEISDREVHKWIQPMFKATGTATFGLIMKRTSLGLRFLVQTKPEIGSFDRLEIGPSIHWEFTHSEIEDNEVEKVFRKQLSDANSIKADVLLSEEGGRFYHEINRNTIIEIPEDMLEDIPQNYIWVSYSTLNYLTQVNNCLNIQLRNLLALINI